ncbi:MAG: sterol desaturase family protein [Myxococcaceae bacterium]|nr:sterol desaturase family protein [Myxococcaceae bacterium]
MDLLSSDLGLLQLGVTSFLAQAANYFVFVGVIFLLVWKLLAKTLAGRRIPTRFDFGLPQVTREVLNTLLTLLLGTVSAVAIVALYRAGLTKLSNGADWAWWQSALALVALLVFNDTWFYWWHRLLHHPKLFKHVHAVHHRSVDVNPFTSYSFHAAEGFILGAWAIPMALLVPMSMQVLMAAQVVGLLNNIVSHLGYELLPRWWLRVPLLNWSSSASYHSLHHSQFNGNYGLLFRFWDRLMGTELKDYERVFRAEQGVEATRAVDPAGREVPRPL